jgi:hypothetical protein
MMTGDDDARIALRRGVGLVAAAGVALCAAVAPPAAQQPPPNPTKEDLAKDNKLFITLARKALKWDELTLWKDADPDIPVVRQAKAECARLQ